ncbi:MAG TPA: carboxypeptidase M32, partial [Sediminispirochaeta sp.]|nr:carboxypeptidase M32 [Sediminispirochaeta sp.]
MKKELQKLREIDHEVQLLRHSAALLQWDQETGMPSEAIAERSDQIALLEGIIHDRLTQPQIEELLHQAGYREDEQLELEEGNPDFEEKAFLRAFSRSWVQAAKLPRRLVTEMAIATSRGQAAWVEARKKNSFVDFEPFLQKILDLNLEKAEALSYDREAYDALLDEFEPGMSAAEVSRVFTQLQRNLRPMVERLSTATRGVDDRFRYRHYPRDRQREFSLRVLRDMGYDFNRGRLDESAHPFTTAVGGKDVRLTTRFNEDDLLNALFGSIHEGGHGLYEMG